MGDIRQGFEDAEEAFRVGVNAQLRYRWSNLRGVISQDSPDGHTAQAQPVTQATVYDSTGTPTLVDLPPCQDMPIAFPGGGGVTSTHPIKSGDEGNIRFDSSAIDAWHQNGGTTQPPIDSRTYALSDGVWHPGGRSDPRKLQNVSTVSGQHRSDDGNHFYDLHPQNGLTHQSTNMVLASVANTAAHLITAQGHQINAPKVCLNCG